MNDIIELATAFQDGIENAFFDGKFSKDIPLRYFPKGCCDVASLLLCRYLQDNGFPSCEVIGGSYYDGNPENNTTHVWVVNGDLIIDITGDQFKTERPFLFDEPVYVGPESKFHRYFDERRFCLDSSLGDYSEEELQKMMSRYNIILKYISNE